MPLIPGHAGKAHKAVHFGRILQLTPDGKEPQTITRDRACMAAYALHYGGMRAFAKVTSS